MMRRLRSVVMTLVLVAVCAPGAAHAASRLGGGALELGARIGVGFPFGHEGRTNANAADPVLSDNVKTLLPIWIDGGYRFNSRFFLGLSFQYGFGFVNKDQNGFCNQAASDCSAHNIRVGINLLYHFLPDAGFDPWVGFGLGYEWLSTSRTLGGIDLSTGASGTEFANLQVGGDIGAGSSLKIGPFISFSFGSYGDQSVSQGNRTFDANVVDHSVHEWLILGLRGVFDIRF